MSEKRIIPITPIWGRYKRLRGAPQRERLAEVQRLVERPEELATEFAASVERFAPYCNVKDSFYPASRPRREPGEEINRTNDLVLRLEKQKRIVPTDAPHRMTEHAAGPVVSAGPARRLASDYVDRELLVQRTTSPAAWEDGRQNVGGLRLDGLLADASDRTPIVGEVKLPGDTGPFFAFIQALACAAHLATIHQYERMRRHLARGEFPARTVAPRLDIWVLFLDPPEYQPGKPPKGRYMHDLQRATETLAPRLLAQEALRGSVRRIAGIGVNPDRSGNLAPEVRWAWGRSA